MTVKRKFNRVRFDVSSAIGNRLAKELIKELSEYNDEIKKELQKVFNSNDAKVLFAEDSSVTSKVSSVLNKLKKKWEKKFNLFSVNWTDLLMSQTNKQSNKQMQLFFDEPFAIKVPMSQKTKDIMKAMSDNASSLIVTVKDRFEDDLQQSVFRLMTGQGLNFSKFQTAFTSMLEDNFKKHRNKALNVALDQTRKVYQKTATRKLIDADVTEFIWRHAGGSKEPRPLHKYKLNGKTFRFDDPPVIDEKTGERGLPADAINCKCYIEPVF